MATPDLPMELWLLILSYLGPTDHKSFRKMIGVNRMFFELGINSLYETMRLERDDAPTLRRFKQLKYRNISQRVRCLLVDPSFLPRASWSYEHPAMMPQRRAIFRHCIANAVHDIQAAIAVNTISDVLYAAKLGIRTCINLREIQITLHERDVTPAFLDFANSIWSNKLVAPSLQKIKVNTTVARLPILLKHISANARMLTSLREFDISFMPTAHIPTPEEGRSVTIPLQHLLQALETLGARVTFSTVLEIRGDFIRPSAPSLPTINNQMLSLHFLNSTLSGLAKITPFANAQANSIKQLNISSIYWNSVIDPWGHADSSCAGFVLCEGKGRFETLRLPFLESLQITISKWGPLLGRLSKYEGQNHPFFSSLSVVAPRLKSLALLGPYFGSVDTTSLITLLADGLKKDDHLVSLRHFEFSCNTLTASIVDLLSSKMTYLTSLVIHPQRLGPGDSDNCSTLTPSFFDAMETRRYDKWGLKRLRITRECECDARQPEILAMKVFARCFASQGIHLDDENKCTCGNWRLI